MGDRPHHIRVIALDTALAMLPTLEMDARLLKGAEIIEQIFACTEVLQAGLLSVKAELLLDTRMD